MYHVTHRHNLDGILGSGAVLAADGLAAGSADVGSIIGSTTSSTTGAIPVDLSSPLTRELRATAEVGAAVADSPSTPRSVAGFVPWYLSADASVWLELRRGAADPRWSAAARDAASVDFVVLVSTVRALIGLDGFVVADGDASAAATQFATDEDQALRMLSRLHDTEQLLEAEVLVSGSVPFEAVQLIGAANEPQRDIVREMLDGASVRSRVSVYPPWFAAPE